MSNCATPETAAHQAPLSLGFSRQEHWSGLPFPSPMHESEKWKRSRSVMSDSSRPHGLQPTRLLHPWDFPGKSTGVGCHCLLWLYLQLGPNVSVSSVQSLSHIWFFVTHGLQQTRLPCPSPTPGACSNSCPSSRWCHPTISSSVVPFSSRLQSSPASGSFPKSQFFASGGQSIEASASASVLPMNIQDWFPLGCTGWMASLTRWTWVWASSQS